MRYLPPFARISHSSAAKGQISQQAANAVAAVAKRIYSDRWIFDILTRGPIPLRDSHVSVIFFRNRACNFSSRFRQEIGFRWRTPLVCWEGGFDDEFQFSISRGVEHGVIEDFHRRNDYILLVCVGRLATFAHKRFGL